MESYLSTRQGTTPIVSVVIPTYNRYQRTQRAVDSVLQQTYPNIELIVVDDGSHQPVQEMLSIPKEKFVRYCVIRHEENRGANAARNTGIKSADGKYISFLDSDDEFHENYIETVVDAFENADPSCAGVYTSYNRIYQEDTTGLSEAIKGRTELEDLEVRNEIGSFSCVTIERKILEEIGLLDESLPSKQDYDLYLRILKSGCHFHGIKEPLVDHYAHDNRISANLAAREFGESRLYKKHSDVLDKKWLSNSLLSRGFQEAKQGNIRTARQHFWESIRINPLNLKAYLFGILSIFGSKIFKTAIQISR